MSTSEGTLISVSANEAFTDKRFNKIATPWLTGSHYIWLTFREAIIKDFENLQILEYIEGNERERIEALRKYKVSLGQSTPKSVMIRALQTMKEKMFFEHIDALNNQWEKNIFLPYYLNGIQPIPQSIFNQAAIEGTTLPRRYSNVVPDPTAVEFTYDEVQDLFDINSHLAVSHINVPLKDTPYDEDDYSLQSLSDMFQDETKALDIQAKYNTMINSF